MFSPKRRLRSIAALACIAIFLLLMLNTMKVVRLGPIMLVVLPLIVFALLGVIFWALGREKESRKNR